MTTSEINEANETSDIGYTHKTNKSVTIYLFTYFETKYWSAWIRSSSYPYRVFAAGYGNELKDDISLTDFVLWSIYQAVKVVKKSFKDRKYYNLVLDPTVVDQKIIDLLHCGSNGKHYEKTTPTRTYQLSISTALKSKSVRSYLYPRIGSAVSCQQKKQALEFCVNHRPQDIQPFVYELGAEELPVSISKYFYFTKSNLVESNQTKTKVSIYVETNFKRWAAWIRSDIDPYRVIKVANHQKYPYGLNTREAYIIAFYEAIKLALEYFPNPETISLRTISPNPVIDFVKIKAQREQDQVIGNFQVRIWDIIKETNCYFFPVDIKTPSVAECFIFSNLQKILDHELTKELIQTYKEGISEIDIDNFILALK